MPEGVLFCVLGMFTQVAATVLPATCVYLCYIAAVVIGPLVCAQSLACTPAMTNHRADLTDYIG